MFRVSGFADEICADLDGQVNFLTANKVRYIELRSVWDKNVLDLSDGELGIIKSCLDSNNIKVSSIGSPIGKVGVAEDFEEHLKRFKKAVHAALTMESKYIRIFSFYMDEEETDSYEETVIGRLKQFTEIAVNNNLILLHENEAGIFGEASERCKKLIEGVGSPSFKAVFDPGNFIMAGEDVYNQSYKNMKPFIEYVHVKDALKDTREIVAAGEGDGYISQLMDGLRYKDGLFVSLEPHLSFAGRFAGFTGPELFRKDLDAFRNILEKLGISYE